MSPDEVLVMKYNKILLWSTLGALGLIYYWCFDYIYTTATSELLDQQIESSKNQANLVSNLLAEKLRSGASRDTVREELQRSIENSPIDNTFVCMFDDRGEEICHPKRELIGRVLSPDNSIIRSLSNQNIEKNFKEAVTEKRAIGGLREMKDYTEIVYLSPVEGANWIVASHSNILRVQHVLDDLKEKLSLIFLLIWVSSSLLIYFFLQYINSKSLQQITAINRETSAHYFKELKSLNQNLSRNLVAEPLVEDRLLANKGARLVPVYIDGIAFVYSENKITHIVEHDGQTSSINLSLEELLRSLNPSAFYRASRQVILSAKAIEKIEKHGNTQLQVMTLPVCPIPIIISKAKITEFKKWVGHNGQN